VRIPPELTEKQIRRGSFRSLQRLEASIRQYLDHHSTQPKSFRWIKSADDILNSLAKYCERTNDSGHFEKVRKSSAKADHLLVPLF
jgi:hypothetical protein